MATRQSALEKIDAIQDKGNNTAREVRDVLTEILNYTENIPFPPIPQIEFFHFMTENLPVRDKLQNPLWYSIKGIAQQYINLTFRIEIHTLSSPTGGNLSDNIFVFPIQDKDEKLLTYLKNITQMDGPNVRFVIPYTTQTQEFTMDQPLSVSIYFKGKTIVFDFNQNIITGKMVEMSITKGQSVSSVTWHFPGFNLGKV